jgi:uncharacterized repeat protein (TIGR01451 family)
MARLKRPSVKVVLVATLLASAGAGTYYATMSDGAWIARLFGHGQLVADDVSTTTAVEPTPSELSQSELDAVASAWAGDAPTETSRAVDARVATACHDEPTTDSENSDDRYQTESAVDSTSENSHYANRTEMPVVLPVVPAQDVTRGQEPTDYGNAQPLGNEQPVEQPTAVTPDDAEATVESSRRAREAFGDDLATAAVPAADASSRYESATAAHAEPPKAKSAAAASPFASVAAPAPLPAAPEEPTEYRPTDIRTANAAYRSVSDSGPNQFGSPAEGAAEPIQGESLGATGEGAGRPGERALEGPQKPALVIQKFAPPEIQVGKAAKFAVQVRNVGTQTAESVVIRDEIPHGARVVNTTPRATNDGAHLVWELGALSTGEERTVEIELMPVSEGEIGSVADVSYSTQASAKTRCTMPQLAIRMTAPSQVMVGQEQRVKIELRNPGTGDATGVMLMENVPENVKHAAGPALEFEIGTLRAGETRELELVLTAEKPGPVVNALTARADGNLQVQQQVEFEVIAPALQLSIEGPERRYLERPATYQVIIENPGTAPAHDIELVTKLPKGMQFVKANNMGEYDAATHSVYWSLAQLPEGEKGSVELVAMPIEPGEQTIQIEGKAQQGLTDEAKQDVLVEGLAAIMFEVRDVEDPIEVGGETTYEIRVVNQGSKAATNVQVLVTLPAGIEAISASGETRHTVQAGGVVFEPLAQLAPKTDTMYRVQVKGVQPGDQRVTVQVNTDDISQPIRREESTRVFGDE